VTSRYGPRKERRMLRCSACKARFSERKGTPLFDSRLPPEKVESVLEHSQTGRLCKVNRGTVGRLSKIAGEHVRDLHDELVALSPPDPRGPVR
jgi:transposase-like protein